MAASNTDEVETLYRYKYLPFNEGSLKMITEGTLKFTCPLEFNDPFDCMPSYSPESVRNIYKTKPDIFKQAGDVQGFSPAKRLQRKGVMLRNLERALESGTFVEDCLSRVGVLSLSRTATNILMWSHYADHHKGFVVELKFSTDDPSGLLERFIPEPVTYTASRPVVDYSESFDIDAGLLTKSIDWEYEAEDRVLRVDDGPGIFPYPREHFLCSVIAGCRMGDADFFELEKAVKKARTDTATQINLYRAEKARAQFMVFVPGHPNRAISEPSLEFRESGGITVSEC